MAELIGFIVIIGMCFALAMLMMIAWFKMWEDILDDDDKQSK
jgi:hypothetical protein|uniref:Holin n=1 Tax=Siphoviridae sp. cteLh2 TaxID=2825590 RepID=A0A8S5U5U7_9CAUD|nr:hypothetical protein [uncultured Lachnoclostridium sp.]DAF89831.1 MAG TPA: holin [Siphoviridae sp. cteLh2]